MTTNDCFPSKATKGTHFRGGEPTVFQHKTVKTNQTLGLLGLDKRKKLSAGKKNVGENNNILKCQLIKEKKIGHVPMSIHRVCLVCAKHVGLPLHVRKQIT